MDATVIDSLRPLGEVAGAVAPGPGRVLAVDVGSVRVGLAITDPDRRLASPLRTVPVSTGGVRDVARAVAAVATDEGVTGIVVGLPLSLSGAHGAAAVGARGFAEVLAALVVPVEVRLADERYTTTTAHRELAVAGRTSRRRRAVIDQAAAVVLLQHVIDADRAAASAGRSRVGTVVHPGGVPT